MSRTVAVLASFAAACAVVRPAKLTPPPPPPSFVVDVTVPTSSAPGAAAAASTERATRSAVWWNACPDPAPDGVIQEALRNYYCSRGVRTLIYENALDPAPPRGWLWPLQIGIPATTPANIQHVVVGSAPFDSVD